jgi:hypothetical protein
MSTPNPVERRRRTRWGRLAVAFVLIVGAAATAQYASADFADPTVVSQNAVAAGTLDLMLGDGDALQVFEEDLPDFYPGAVHMRAFNITISGTADLKTLTFTPSDSCVGCATSSLTNDVTDGLRVGIERCSVPWTPHPGTAPPTELYICSDIGGGVFGGTYMLPSTPLIPWDTINDTSVTLSTGLSSFTVGSTYYYALYFQLPSTTSTATLDKSSTVEYTFTGSQRDAAAK